ncbi:hypothetical protein HYU22_00205, partial [Candidatus Woesearchaeota archaeon]|nr:hypothetical protein [Candidatus Woesearchaeota archaeon]
MQKKRFIGGLLFVFIIALLAYLVLAVGEAPQLVTPANQSNFSSSFEVNITTLYNFTNVTLIFWNYSSPTQAPVTTFVVENTSVAVNGTRWNITVTLSGLSDGIYNLSINGTNVTSDNKTVISNESALKAQGFIRIDKTNPAVFDFNNISKRNFTTGNSIEFNVSVNNLSFNRNGTDFHVVYFQVSNGTAFSSTSFNITNATASNDTLYSMMLSVSNIRDGNHTVMVFTNDTAGNVNKSVAINTSFIV